MVDQERIDRLLDRISSDIRELQKLAVRGSDLLTDRTALAATKYYFITAIEGCARVAAEGVLSPELAEAVARAVGFRNILVHEYAELDNHRVVANLDRLEDLRGFVTAVARWSNSRG